MQRMQSAAYTPLLLFPTFFTRPPSPPPPPPQKKKKTKKTKAIEDHNCHSLKTKSRNGLYSINLNMIENFSSLFNSTVKSWASDWMAIPLLTLF